MSARTKSNAKTGRDYRVALLKKGRSVRGWALSQGYNPVTVHFAIHGKRKGEISRTILRELERFLHE